MATHVDDTPSGEVEDAPAIRPAVRVPAPVRNRIVDEGRPEEDPDERGRQATSLSGRANRDDGAAASVEQSCHEAHVMAAKVSW